MYNIVKIDKKIKKILCILLVLITTVGMSKPNNEDKKKIYKNIYIENLCVGGLTREEAIIELSKQFVLDPLVIKYSDKCWIINPKDINLVYDIEGALSKAYNFTHDEDNIENIKRIMNLNFGDGYKINLETYYDEAKLSQKLSEIAKEIDIKVKDASIYIKDSGEIVRTDSKDGLEVDIIKLKESIYDMIINHKIDEIYLPVNVIKPSIASEDVKSINTVLGQYSTSFNQHSARGSNVQVAAKSTSDKLIMPHESFSYNNTTGYRSWSNGYKTAKVIIGGKLVNGEGGGVCQVSTTIYNAALLAGMQIDEVHNHTIQSHYVARGRDAAVSYGYTDFKFKNGYSHPIYIKNIVNNGSITSKIYGCKDDREKLYIKTKENYSKDKINVKTYRVYLDEENNKIREELITDSTYKNQ